MPRGGKREGAGRPKGSVSQSTRKMRRVALAALEDGLSPLEYMLQVLRDPEASDQQKAWAAEKAAPYVHPRLASHEHSGEDGGPLKIEIVRFSADNPPAE